MLAFILALSTWRALRCRRRRRSNSLRAGLSIRRTSPAENLPDHSSPTDCPPSHLIPVRVYGLISLHSTYSNQALMYYNTIRKTKPHSTSSLSPPPATKQPPTPHATHQPPPPTRPRPHTSPSGVLAARLLVLGHVLLEPLVHLSQVKLARPGPNRLATGQSVRAGLGVVQDGDHCENEATSKSATMPNALNHNNDRTRPGRSRPPPHRSHSPTGTHSAPHSSSHSPPDPSPDPSDSVPTQTPSRPAS